MNYFAELQSTIQRLDHIKLQALLAFVKDCEGTLWLAGNGGSASTAQHWACDLSKTANRRVQALGSNPAVLTAWANDRDYDEGMAQELFMIARPDDALICLSCSGISPNILAVLEQASIMKLSSALVTSQLSRQLYSGNKADLIISVPHTHYGIIEDCHLAIGHWLTEELQK